MDRSDPIDSPQQLEFEAKDDDLKSQSAIDRSILPNVDVKAELDSLLLSLQLAIPQPPSSDLTRDLWENETVNYPEQLLPILNTTRDRITSIYANLQVIHQQNQVQVDTIDSSILEVKQLKFRTQQLARHSKNQLEKAEQMLGSIEKIHAEIVTSLAKFGGYAEIQAMLVQLETTRHSLVIAHDRATTGQEAFYDSLRAIQVAVAARSDDSEHKLGHYHQSIQSLSQSILADRLQVTTMSVDLSTKLADLQSLSTQITTTNTQIVAASETMQSRIVEIDREFSQLSASVQTEKEQFYQLTVEAIEKANQIGSQLTNIVKQIDEDRDSIAKLKADIDTVRYTVRQETEQKLNNLDLRYHQLLSTWDDFQVRQKDRAITAKKFSRWLWILSFAVLALLVMLIRVLMVLK